MQNNRIIWTVSVLTLGVLITLIYLFFARFTSAPSDETATNLKFITGNKLIYVDCGKAPCSFTVQRNSDGGYNSDKKYASISVLNPATQTFQAKFYTADSWTWGYGGGIAYIGSSDYAMVIPPSTNQVIEVGGGYQTIKKDFYVQNITATELGELRSWWWYSSLYDGLIIFGVPIGFLIIMGLILALVNGIVGAAEDTVKGTVDYLGTKEGKKLLDKIDKNIRKRY